MNITEREHVVLRYEALRRQAGALANSSVCLAEPIVLRDDNAGEVGQICVFLSF